MTKEEIERLEKSSIFKFGGLVQAKRPTMATVISGPNAGSVYKIVHNGKPVTKEGYVLQHEGKKETRLWVRAFNEYNNDKNNKRLGMGCKPCYSKVLFYHKRKLNENTPR